MSLYGIVKISSDCLALLSKTKDEPFGAQKKGSE